jgi:predicted RNA-binding Zn-ribbon protein involved in translation (DUF1610 family)
MKISGLVEQIEFNEETSILTFKHPTNKKPTKRKIQSCNAGEYVVLNGENYGIKMAEKTEKITRACPNCGSTAQLKEDVMIEEGTSYPIHKCGCGWWGDRK